MNTNEHDYSSDFDVKFYNEKEFLKATKGERYRKLRWSRPNNVKTTSQTHRSNVNSSLRYFKNDIDSLQEYVYPYPKIVLRASRLCHCCDMIARGRGKR